MTIATGKSWIKRRAVLLLLFVGYLVTSTVLVEQQHTIESQRVLIRDLFHDSVELNNIRMKEAAVKLSPDAGPVPPRSHQPYR